MNSVMFKSGASFYININITKEHEKYETTLNVCINLPVPVYPR